MPRLVLIIAALALLSPQTAAARPAAAASSTPVRILIHTPSPGEPLRNKVHQAPIRGTAAADGERF